MQRIEADVLVPGRGTPIVDGCVIIEGTAITYAGPGNSAPATPSATVTKVPAVMPGLWDCHTHFTGLTTPNIDEAPRIPQVLAGVRSAKDAEAALNAGFTSIREAGGLGVYLARAVEEGTVVGPNIYAAGSILSTTGGHGDLHSYPLDWVLDYEASGGWLSVCDGVPECLKATRKQLRRNAKVIKVCASGGVMSEVDHPIHQQFSAEELRAIVEEAARAERIVMAHCHGKPGIKAALDAGVVTIEHGTYLDEETAVQMKEQETILVPTRFIVERLLAGGKTSAYPNTPTVNWSRSPIATCRRSLWRTMQGSESHSEPTSRRVVRTLPCPGVPTAKRSSIWNGPECRRWRSSRLLLRTAR